MKTIALVLLALVTCGCGALVGLWAIKNELMDSWRTHGED